MMWKFVFIVLMLPIFCGSLAAYNDEPGCYRDLKTTFFNPDLAKQAFANHYRTVSQSSWSVIISLLQARSQDVPEILSIRANRMNPNPLEYPFNAPVAADLLFDTLYQIFSDVLHGYNVYNEGEIREMFDYIKQQQSSRIQPCLEQG